MDEKDSVETEGNEVSNNNECTICLQPFAQPVQLPCKHAFCYLCVKGIIQQNNKCALCRKVIPRNYMDNPQLVHAQQLAGGSNGSYQWFYEGRNGWWQYDDRTSIEIETAYQNKDTQCEVLIAGFVYTIDFQRNLQFRKFNPGCRRRIKRDLVTVSKKGVAGIHQNHDIETNNCKESCSNNSSCNTTVPANSIGKKLLIVIPHNGTPGIQITLGNEVLSTSNNSEASCSNTHPCNQITSRTSTDSITVSDARIAGVHPSSDAEVIPESSNCKAPCSNDNSSNWISPEKMATENDDAVSPPPSKRKRTGSSNILQISEHILKQGEGVYKAFGDTVTAKLQEMNNAQRLYAEKIINDALFQGLLGKLSENSHIT